MEGDDTQAIAGWTGEADGLGAVAVLVRSVPVVLCQPWILRNGDIGETIANAHGRLYAEELFGSFHIYY